MKQVWNRWLSLFSVITLFLSLSAGLLSTTFAAEVGVEWVNEFHGRNANLSYSDDMAVGFYNRLGGSSYWDQSFNWGDDLAWERDFRDRSLGGDDHIWIDNVDFAYFSSHGGSWNNEHHGSFGVMRDKWDYNSSELRLGDLDLEWLAVDTCESLNASNDAWFYMWDQTFRGLHLIVGHNGYSYDNWWTRKHGERFAQYLRIGDPVSRAWFRAINEDWFVNQHPAAMAAGPTPSAMWFVMDNDHIWGHGMTVSDPVANWFGLRYYD